jgi:hypothetical protein
MTKREDIDQMKHDYFMLSKRVELLEHRVSGFLSADARGKMFQPLPLIGKTLEDVQKAWNDRNSSSTSKERASSD